MFLSCTGSLAILNQYTEYGLLPVLNAVHCNGTEGNIFDCESNEGDGRCQQRQDASVICQGK